MDFEKFMKDINRLDQIDKELEEIQKPNSKYIDDKCKEIFGDIDEFIKKLFS